MHENKDRVMNMIDSIQQVYLTLYLCNCDLNISVK